MLHCKSVPCLTSTYLRIISLSPAIQPIRKPGQNIFEKLPVHRIFPASSKDFIDGKDSPPNLNSPYGLSSITVTPYFADNSANFLRLSRLHVFPVGFWKVGIAYISFIWGVLLKTSSKTSIIIPSSSVGISIKLHPYALNALIAAKYVGLSQSTISPSSRKTFPDKSNPCCEPWVIRILSLSKVVPKRSFIRLAIHSRKGT